MQTRIAAIVTLALVSVVAAVIAVKLARAVARHLARYLDTVEGFAAAAAGGRPVAPHPARSPAPVEGFAAAVAGCPTPASIGGRPGRGRTPGLETSLRRGG